jgi:hypothetical protein
MRYESRLVKRDAQVVTANQLYRASTVRGRHWGRDRLSH